MRSAATLLQSTRSVDALSELLVGSGLCGPSEPLESETRAQLGIDVGDARLAGGPGALRFLVLAIPARTPLRDAVQRLTRRLAARAAHVSWIIATVRDAGTEAAISAWRSDGRPHRISTFRWEPGRVVDSDAETLCALAAVRADDDELRHARYLDVLGREALSRRFYRALEFQVGSLARAIPDEDGRAVALLYASRLLFLAFLEAKGWLDGNRAFLADAFDECMRGRGDFHRRALLPLFFGTLNTPVRRRATRARAFGRIPFLNGGLFTRSAIERRATPFHFPDEALGAFIGEILQRYRFVAREDSASWSEASVDPEMLGRTFESLMGAPERRGTGVYYTPHDLVARVADQALQPALLGSDRASIGQLRVLDPACGSGAFLVHALERIASYRRDVLGEDGEVATIRRDVLARSIFGIDRNPTAVWLCELRLWLSVVIESGECDPLRVVPLPNLDRNIRIGDALAGPGFSADIAGRLGARELIQLRGRYVRATGKRKQCLARALDAHERRRVLGQLGRDVEALRHARRELLLSQRARDLFGERPATPIDVRRELKRLREELRARRREFRRIDDGGALPFSFSACFADADRAGGFDVVIGNPPWVRLHRIPIELRQLLKRSFEVFRAASWTGGAESANVATGFASQVDLAALFVERSGQVLRDDGHLALLLPAKLWRSLAGGGVRAFLAARMRVSRIEDLSESPSAFDAAVYPSLVAARKTIGNGVITAAVHRGASRAEWELPFAQLPFDATIGAPWILLRPDARQAFDVFRRAGPPLAHSAFGSPRLGVKSGCNAAFVVHIQDIRNGVATIVDANGEQGAVEAELVRPALRGESVVPWRRMPTAESIIWTHDAHGAPLARLPDRARKWLRRHYGTLTARADAARSRRWWTLFRTDAADCSAARVVWADFGRRPRALVLDAGDDAVPLNTCYVVRCRDAVDAHALAAILNSPLAAAWLNALAEPARGNYRRYLGWTVGQLPLPYSWTRARELLAAAQHDDTALIDAVLAAYGLSLSNVRPLLDDA